MNRQYRDELAALAEGLEVNRYYDAWRLTLLLWRSIWYHSNTDWSKYRARIWGMFAGRVEQAARTRGDLDGFFSQAAHMLNLSQIGANEDDRQELVRLLALSSDERGTVMRQLREDVPLLVALVRRWRDVHKEEREREKADEGQSIPGSNEEQFMAEARKEEN